MKNLHFCEKILDQRGHRMVMTDCTPWTLSINGYDAFQSDCYCTPKFSSLTAPSRFRVPNPSDRHCAQTVQWVLPILSERTPRVRDPTVPEMSVSNCARASGAPCPFPESRVLGAVAPRNGCLVHSGLRPAWISRYRRASTPFISQICGAKRVYN